MSMREDNAYSSTTQKIDNGSIDVILGIEQKYIPVRSDMQRSA